MQISTMLNIWNTIHLCDRSALNKHIWALNIGLTNWKMKSFHKSRFIYRHIKIRNGRLGRKMSDVKWSRLLFGAQHAITCYAQRNETRGAHWGLSVRKRSVNRMGLIYLFHFNPENHVRDRHLYYITTWMCSHRANGEINAMGESVQTNDWEKQLETLFRHQIKQ